MVILGAGNLGLALADYAGFRHDGFDVVALLDTAREKVGQYSRSGVPIRHARELERLVEREKIDIAVVTVPADAAQEVVDAVVARRHPRDPQLLAGHRSGCRQHVKLKNMDLTVTFESLSFFLRQWPRPRGPKRPRVARLTHADAGGPRADGRRRRQGRDSRVAVARGFVRVSAAARRLVRTGAVKKGDPLQAARLAGIMAAKSTATLIPLCHPLSLTGVEVDDRSGAGRHRDREPRCARWPRPAWRWRR